MKYLPHLLSLFAITFGGGVLVAHAAGGDYVPLAPLPGTVTGGTGHEITNMVTYLSGAVKLLVALGGALAILMAIIGGTKYVAAGISPSAKSDAKSQIEKAFIGLALILSSYLILNSINPNLVNVDFKLSNVGINQLTLGSTTNRWSDSAERSILIGVGIIVKEPSCTAADEQGRRSGCTSVFNLNGMAISGLRNLSNNCSATLTFGGYCDIVVTGGTEYWLHQTHGNGSREQATKVDLRKAADLNRYIIKNGQIPETPCGLHGVPKYQPDGPTNGTYVDEGDHWHVCY